MLSTLRKSWPAAAAMLVGGAIAALAANTTFFTSIGDVIFPFSPPALSGTPGTIDNMTIGATTPAAGTFTQIQGSSNVAVKAGVPVAPFTHTFSKYETEFLMQPSGTQSYEYVTLAAAPVNNARACIFSTQTITLLYVLANAGQSINNAVTTLAANGRVCYTYSSSNTTWDRSQ